MMNSFFSGFFLQLITGAWITIQLALCALLLGLLLGLLGTAGETCRLSGVRRFVTALISGIRGLPELVVIFLVYFGGTLLFSKLLGHYVNLSPFVAGVLALALLFGAYASQVFHGALLAIPKGQLEAGRALGLNREQLFFHIQLPQMCRHALPGLGNLWLVLLKDTALVSLIGLHDLMNSAQVAASTTHRPFTFYLLASLFYLLITSISQLVLHQAAQKANRHLAV
jgi:His/Glu/Gln/Arg/opine family amino acid ABC transporter permease subunit